MYSSIKYILLLRNYMIFNAYRVLSKITTKTLSIDEKADFVVSIASYPKRDPLLPGVFQALSRQTVLPRKWVLVLSVEDYPEGLPPHLLRLERRGLDIIWVEDNPYAVKKLLPVMERFPELAAVTIDDDIIYHPSLLQGLISRAKLNRTAVIGYVGKVMLQQQGSLGMYYRGPKPADLNTPTNQVYLIGWGGIYYPSASLDPRVLDMDAVHRMVPGRGSDIWFWAAAHAQGTPQICLGIPQAYNLGIPIPLNAKTAPKDRPETDVLLERFQMAIDFFGIRGWLLERLPEHADNNNLG